MNYTRSEKIAFSTLDGEVCIFCSESGKSLRFKFSRSTGFLISFITSISLFVLILSIGLNVYFFEFHSKSKKYVDNQDSQNEVIQKLQSEILSLRYMATDLVEKEEMIRQDLGRPKYRSLVKKKNIRTKISSFNKGYPLKEDSLNSSTHQISNQMNYLKKHLLSIERNFRKHLFIFEQYQDWFDEMPSIWPVYGHIQSKYGWRMHPLTRRKQFHKGIDIPAWIGAPVHATADGYVQFSGWDTGYGWMVVISHNFAYRTIYAHMSEIDVLQGIRVSKGQIIGKIGNSGRSTGPHIHYEIRKGRKALDPLDYLDLDLFTAVSKLW